MVCGQRTVGHKKAGGNRWQCSKALYWAGTDVIDEAGPQSMEELLGDEEWRPEFKKLCVMFADIREDRDRVRLDFYRLPKETRSAMAKTMVELGLIGEPPTVAK